MRALGPPATQERRRAALRAGGAAAARRKRWPGAALSFHGQVGSQLVVELGRAPEASSVRWESPGAQPASSPTSTPASLPESGERRRGRKRSGATRGTTVCVQGEVAQAGLPAACCTCVLPPPPCAGAPRLKLTGVATVAYQQDPISPFGAVALGCSLGFVSPTFQAGAGWQQCCPWTASSARCPAQRGLAPGHSRASACAPSLCTVQLRGNLKRPVPGRLCLRALHHDPGTGAGAAAGRTGVASRRRQVPAARSSADPTCSPLGLPNSATTSHALSLASCSCLHWLPTCAVRQGAGRSVHLRASLAALPACQPAALWPASCLQAAAPRQTYPSRTPCSKT